MNYKQCVSHGVHYYHPNCPICFYKQRLLCQVPEDKKLEVLYEEEYKILKSNLKHFSGIHY